MDDETYDRLAHGRHCGGLSGRVLGAGQRDINIGMNGVSLKVDSEGFWVASEVPLQVVSSSVGARPRRDQPYPQRGSVG